MSIFGPHLGPNSGLSPGGNSGGQTTTAGTYGRGDLQAAFNWLVNQPEQIRKQASDPDRLMTLYYRSSGRPEMIRTTEITRTTDSIRQSERTEPARAESVRIETEAPVSGQTFISDLRQINEALRQFDGPTAQATIHTPLPAPQPVMHSPMLNPGPTDSPEAKTQAILTEVREKLNLSNDGEAMNVLISLGYRRLKPLLD
jgi:hypothetical protein